MPSRNISLEWGPWRPIRLLTPSKSNFEIDSTSHYRESTALRYPIYIRMRHQVLKSVTYYPLHVDFPWTGVHNLTRYCYHLSRLPLKSLSYISYLLCDQLTYSSSKEHMSNSTKWITVTTNFLITCSLDYPRWHTVSIP